jgi:PTH1 family peptidyl-tRNA hydrolase
MSEFNLDEIKIVVGLGNPGTEYENTRHNAGAMLLEYLREKWEFPEFKHDKYSNAMLSKGTRNGNQVVLVFPHTYMNESGKSVAYLMEKELLQPSQLLVLHDDKDFLFEEIKLQKEISSAGHKGVQSIIDSLETSNFWRLRIGIGPVPEPLTTDIFVLQKFTTEEITKLESIFDNATKILQ